MGRAFHARKTIRSVDDLSTRLEVHGDALARAHVDAVWLADDPNARRPDLLVDFKRGVPLDLFVLIGAEHLISDLLETPVHIVDRGSLRTGDAPTAKDAVRVFPR